MSRKNFRAFFLIIFFASLVRLLYYFHAPGIIVSEDTWGYYERGELMVTTKVLVDPWRTPLYPLFLQLPLLIRGGFRSKIFSAPFESGMLQIILLQSVIAVFSVPLLYLLLLRLKINRKISVLYCFFVSLDILVFCWDRLLLTESLTVSLLIASTLWAVSMIGKANWRNSFVLLLLLLVSFLLRPVFILLPVALILPLILSGRKKKTVVPLLTVLALFALFIKLYVSLNGSLNRYNGISHISDINLLGKILQFHLPVASGKSSGIAYDTLTAYLNQKGELMPWRYLEKFPAVYSPRTEYNYESIRKFNSLVIKNNLPSFLFQSLKQLPGALLDTSEKVVLVDPHRNLAAFIFNLLFQIFKKLEYLTLLVFIFYPVSFLAFLKKADFKNTAVFIIGNVAVYEIILSVFFSYGEFGRLISVVQPELYLFIFWWIYQSVSFVSRHLKKA